MTTTIWTDLLQSHLELALQTASKLRADDRLTAENLNKVLDLLEQVRTTFLFQCELQGFKTEKKQ